MNITVLDHFLAINEWEISSSLVHARASPTLDVGILSYDAKDIVATMQIKRVKTNRSYVQMLIANAMEEAMRVVLYQQCF